MKYLAILKDSWREALDTKVLYFTVGLSLFVILGAASFSFKQEPADQGLRTILKQFRDLQSNSFNPRPLVSYEFEDFKQLNEGRPPWEGEFQFRLLIQDQEEGGLAMLAWLSSLEIADASKLSREDQESRKRLMMLRETMQNIPRDEVMKVLNQKIKEEIQRVQPEQKERFVREQLAMHGNLTATEVKLLSVDGGKTSMDVQARAKEGAFLTWPHKLSLFFGAVTTPLELPIGPLIFLLEDKIVCGIGAGITMLLSSIITAFFIPNMLRKGTIDMLLAKPIRRTWLLVNKYIGGLTFMFLNTTLVIVGIWLVVGLRSGIWNFSFLATIFILTFQFAIFYAVSTLFGVLTRSPIVSILTSCMLWALLFVVGYAYQYLEIMKKFDPYPAWVHTTADTVHFVLPRYKDLDLLSTQLLSRDLLGQDSTERKMNEEIFSRIRWDESIIVTILFIAVMLGISCWWFAKRDY